MHLPPYSSCHRGPPSWCLTRCPGPRPWLPKLGRRAQAPSVATSSHHLPAAPALTGSPPPIDGRIHHMGARSNQPGAGSRRYRHAARLVARKQQHLALEPCLRNHGLPCGFWQLAQAAARQGRGLGLRRGYPCGSITVIFVKVFLITTQSIYTRLMFQVNLLCSVCLSQQLGTE